jgi:hypothetical protein
MSMSGCSAARSAALEFGLLRTTELMMAWTSGGIDPGVGLPLPPGIDELVVVLLVPFAASEVVVVEDVEVVTCMVPPAVVDVVAGWVVDVVEELLLVDVDVVEVDAVVVVVVEDSGGSSGPADAEKTPMELHSAVAATSATNERRRGIRGIVPVAAGPPPFRRPSGPHPRPWMAGSQPPPTPPSCGADPA